MLSFITIQHFYRNISETIGNEQNFLSGPKTDVNAFDDSSIIRIQNGINNVIKTVDWILCYEREELRRRRKRFERTSSLIIRMSVYMITLLFNIYNKIFS